MLVPKARRPCPPVSKHRPPLHRVARGQNVLRATRGGRARFVRADRDRVPHRSCGRRDCDPRMKKRKLLIGLSSAGVLLGGFGGTVLPAAADRSFEVQSPRRRSCASPSADGKTLAEIVPGAIVSATEVGPASAPAGAGAGAHAAPRDHAARPAPAVAPPPAPTPQTARATPAKPTATPKRRPGRAAIRARPTATKGEGPRRRAPARPTAEAKAQGEAEKAKARRAGQGDAAGAPAARPTRPSRSRCPGPAPIGVPNFFIEKFRIPPFLLPIYQAAGIQYGVRWEVLAAINEIETDYGRNLNVSTAGARRLDAVHALDVGAYGVDANGDGRKDPYNPVDAIFAAARYLKAAGADQDLRKAIFAYNHADWYVDSVLLRARLIGGLPADLVGSLTGLTQGRFPVHAHAALRRRPRRAATRRACTGRTPRSRSRPTPRAARIDIFAQGRRARRRRPGRQDRRDRHATPAPRQLHPAARRLRQHLHVRAPRSRSRTAYPVPQGSARSPTPQSAQELELGARPTRSRPARQRRRPQAAPGARRAAPRGAAARRAPPAADAPRRRRQGAPVRQPGAARRASTPAARSSSSTPARRRRSRRSRATSRRSTASSAPTSSSSACKVGSRVIAGTILGRIGRPRPTARPARRLRDPPGRQAARRGSTPSRSSTAGSCSSRRRSTAPPARTRSSAPTPRTRRSARSC